MFMTLPLTGKLVILKGWKGSHNVSNTGDASLYYDGRAVTMSLTADSRNTTKEYPPKLENNLPELKRLGELAVCSSFPYVKVSGYERALHVGVGNDTQNEPDTVRKSLKPSDPRYVFHMVVDDLGNVK